MSYEIERMLVVSTGHLTAIEAGSDLSVLGRSTLKRPEGFLIHTRLGMERDERIIVTQQEAKISSSARGCFQLGRALNCEWVLFDRDGPTLNQFKTYDW